MRLLLDTHAFLWFSANSSKLSSKAKLAIEDPDNEKLLSVVVGWEIAIKHRLGKLSLDRPIIDLLNDPSENSDWVLFNIELPHIAEVAELPFYHRDPFDRMLVAQSLVGEFPIVSCDEHFDAYDVERLW